MKECWGSGWRLASPAGPNTLLLISGSKVRVLVRPPLKLQRFFPSIEQLDLVGGVAGTVVGGDAKRPWRF
jgi:hypothetical protein